MVAALAKLSDCVRLPTRSRAQRPSIVVSQCSICSHRLHLVEQLPRALCRERCGQTPAEIRRDRTTDRSSSAARSACRRATRRRPAARAFPRVRWRWRRAAADTRRRARRRAPVRPRAPGRPPRRESRGARPGPPRRPSESQWQRYPDPGLERTVRLESGPRCGRRTPAGGGPRRPAPARRTRPRPAWRAACRRCPESVRTSPRRGEAPVAPTRRTLPVPMIAPSSEPGERVGHASGDRAGGEARARRVHLLSAGTPRRPVPLAAPRAGPSRCARPGQPRRAGARPRAPSRTAACCRPRPRGCAAERSPVVVRTTISVCAPAARRRSETACACHRASRLPRVAILNTRGVVNGAALRGQSARLDPRACRRRCLAFRRQVKQPVQRVGVGDDEGIVSDRLQVLGRREQQLLDEQARHLVDLGARLRASDRPAWARAGGARPAGCSRSAAAGPRSSARSRATEARRQSARPPGRRSPRRSRARSIAAPGSR